MVEQPTTTDLGRTVWGLDPNVAAVLAYAIGWVSGIVLLIVEPNRFVRFHAWQSTIAFGGLSLAWMVLMYKAYQGERFKVPVAGEMAEQRA